MQARFYALNHPKQVEFDKGVMEFIVKDLQAWLQDSYSQIFRS